MFDLKPHSPTQEIHDEILSQKGVQLFIKREDLLHPEISGNKWRKLKYNFIQARKEGYDTVLTFGGAYSNHIYATAAAARALGFESIGIIRGERTVPLNSTLHFASRKGMKLHYLNRSDYREKTDDRVLRPLREEFGGFYLIPEGGTNTLAIQGCTEILNEVSVPYDIVCCSVGTGGTVAGIIESLKGEKQVIGFSALKGDFLAAEVSSYLNAFSKIQYSNWEIQGDYHFGGYAKIDPLLLSFIKAFKEKHDILLDPVYTGKMIFGVYDLVQKGRFPSGTSLLAIHTGGLQGWQGIKERYSSGFDLSFLD